MERAFQRFSTLHAHDSEVHFFRLIDDRERYEKARVKFDVRKVPAFVIADEPQTEGNGIDPYLCFERGVFTEYNNEEKIFRLLTDIHYLVKDEGLLKLRTRRILERTSEFLKKTWEVIKDAISVGMAVRGGI